MKKALGLAVLAALAALIITLNILRPWGDTGALAESCGELRWDPARFPVAVMLDETADDWTPIVQDAAKTWNRITERELLTVQIASPSAVDEFVSAKAGSGPEPVGRVLVVAGDVVSAATLVAVPPPPGADDGWAWTALRWNPSTCVIGYGAIRLPDGEPLPERVRRQAVLHQLGHVLGLAHDADPMSVMHVEIKPPKPGEPWFDRVITAKDVKLLRSRAG